MMTLLFTFVPLIGLVFSFTNTVGAALWAADIEARDNLIEGPRPNTTGSAVSSNVDDKTKVE